MSAITSKALSRCWSRKREYTEVVSLPVPALISAPSPSKIWSISVELKRAVPLNSRCSRKCEIPACSTVSLRDPTRIQKPSATERTEGSSSVTTRTPEPSSVSWCPSVWLIDRLAPVSAMIAAAAVPATVTSPAATAARAAVAAAARATIARAHGGELLGGLAGDLRVVGEAQPDAAALLVDLDHAHAHLVAAVEHVLNRLGALAGRDVRDVQ